MRASRHIAALCLTGAFIVPVEALGDAPQRVVSMNLCTDQLAMMIAAPGQLHAVSHLATDPRQSPMAEEAAKLEVTHGLAEEIYLMDPDLVISGSFSSAATLGMLRRLDIPVAVFEPAYGLDDVADRVREMGRILGREEAAEAVATEYETRLAVLRSDTSDRPDAALYYANGYTAGDRTLPGEILEAAGFRNAAIAAGFETGGFMPLEVLALLDPDALITSRPAPRGASRAEEILDHPVVRALRSDRASAGFTDRDWVCGTPFVLDAIEGLAELRRNMADNG